MRSDAVKLYDVAIKNNLVVSKERGERREGKRDRDTGEETPL